ncbi:MAG: tripartite tricarboxylate transporter TctB family protein [Aminobacteriaceae bacterium]
MPVETANTPERKTPPFFRNPDRISGLLLMASALFFFSFTVTGKWSTGAGIGARLFPQLSLGAMFLTGAAIFFSRGETSGSKHDEVTPPRIISFMGLAVLFVFGVLRLGLAVGTFLYLAAIFFHFGKDGGMVRKVLLPALGITLLIWGLFTYFAQIVLPPALLF